MPEHATPPRLLPWGVAILLAGAVLGLGAGPIPADVDPVEYDKAARTILCDCGCNPQSVHDCACGRAAEMRDEIAGLIRAGMSGDEVIEAYVASKGEQIRIAPTASGFNLVAWLGPSILFVVTTVGLAWVLRRWKRTAAAVPSAPPVPVDPEDPYVKRLQQELEKSP